MTPDQFIPKWQASTLKERSAVQSHFIDLCELLGVAKPTDADPKGEWYCFERGASKTAGGEGWADVWKRGHFGWEYKGKRKDLRSAYAQLQQYAVALENPPLLVACDMDQFVMRRPRVAPSFKGKWARDSGKTIRRLGYSELITLLKIADRTAQEINLPRGVHKFFGFEEEVDQLINSVIGRIQFIVAGEVLPRSLRLGNNHMEKITMPIPESYGFSAYDGTIIEFERIQNGFRIRTFEPNEYYLAHRQEKSLVPYHMGSGRPYGFRGT